MWTATPPDQSSQRILNEVEAVVDTPKVFERARRPAKIERSVQVPVDIIHVDGPETNVLQKLFVGTNIDLPESRDVAGMLIRRGPGLRF